MTEVKNFVDELFESPFEGFVGRLVPASRIQLPTSVDRIIDKYSTADNYNPETVYNWLQKRGYKVNEVPHDYIKSDPRLGINKYGEEAVCAIDHDIRTIYIATDLNGYKLPGETKAAAALHEAGHEYAESEQGAQKIATIIAKTYFPDKRLLDEIYRITENIVSSGER